MPSPGLKLLQSAAPALAQLDSPQYVEEARRQDVAPYNVEELDSALRDRRHQGPRQQQTLMAERDRIKGMQIQQLQQAMQMLPQKLNQTLDLRSHVPPAPEDQMVKLMVQMRRRYPGMPPQGPESGSYPY